MNEPSVNQSNVSKARVTKAKAKASKARVTKAKTKASKSTVNQFLATILDSTPKTNRGIYPSVFFAQSQHRPYSQSVNCLGLLDGEVWLS